MQGFPINSQGNMGQVTEQSFFGSSGAGAGAPMQQSGMMPQQYAGMTGGNMGQMTEQSFFGSSGNMGQMTEQSFFGSSGVGAGVPMQQSGMVPQEYAAMTGNMGQLTEQSFFGSATAPQSPPPSKPPMQQQPFLGSAASAENTMMQMMSNQGVGASASMQNGMMSQQYGGMVMGSGPAASMQNGMVSQQNGMMSQQYGGMAGAASTAALAQNGMIQQHYAGMAAAASVQNGGLAHQYAGNQGAMPVQYSTSLMQAPMTPSRHGHEELGPMTPSRYASAAYSQQLPATPARYSGVIYEESAGMPNGSLAAGHYAEAMPISTGQRTPGRYQAAPMVYEDSLATSAALPSAHYASGSSIYTAPLTLGAGSIPGAVTTTIRHPPTVGYPLGHSAALAYDTSDIVVDGPYYGGHIVDAGYQSYGGYSAGRPLPSATYTREYVRTSPPRTYSAREYINAPGPHGHMQTIYEGPPLASHMAPPMYERPMYEESHGRRPRRRYDGREGAPPPRSRSAHRRPVHDEPLGAYTPSKYRRNPFAEDMDFADGPSDGRYAGLYRREPRRPQRPASPDGARESSYRLMGPERLDGAERENRYSGRHPDGPSRDHRYQPAEPSPFGERSPLTPGRRNPDRDQEWYGDRVRDRESRFR